MKKKVPGKQGKIIPNGVRPESQEIDTILFYTDLGKKIELIVPSNTPGNKRPDYFMDGLEWEAKSPTVNTRKAIERIFYRATSQSNNIIMDLRRLKGKDTMAIKVTLACFRTTRKARNLHIIERNGELRIYKK